MHSFALLGKDYSGSDAKYIALTLLSTTHCYQTTHSMGNNNIMVCTCICDRDLHCTFNLAIDNPQYKYALSSGTCHMKSLSRNVKYLSSALGEITSVSVCYIRSSVERVSYQVPLFHLTHLHTSHAPMEQTDMCCFLHTPICFTVRFSTGPSRYGMLSLLR